jgi:hypothetical protein
MALTRRQRLIAAPLAGLGALAVGWTGLWFAARYEADKRIDAFLTREADRGRRWACDGRAYSGYPLRIAVHCPVLAFEGTLSGEATRFTARDVTIGAPLTSPRRQAIEATGPLEGQFGALRGKVEWSGLRLFTRVAPQRLERLALATDNMRILAKSGEAPEIPEINVTIGKAHVNMRADVAPAGAPAHIESVFSEIRAPLVDALTGDPANAMVIAVASLSQMEKLLGRAPAPERIEQWRAAGGRLNLHLLNIQKGAASVQAEGDLGLDQTHRPDGKLDLRLRNAGPMTLRLTQNLGLLPRAGLATTLATAALSREGEVHWPLSVESGALSLGPLKQILKLPPLY